MGVTTPATVRTWSTVLHMSRNWKRALITGASSGIGRELARQLAERGTDLVIVARDVERLEAVKAELNSVEVEVLPTDLRMDSDVRRVELRLADSDRPVDLLINNAGFASGGPFVDNDIDVESSVVSVNVSSVMRLSHAAASAMVDRGQGGIVNISSLAGSLVAPGSAVYSATKAFVTSFSESLHQELAASGITVTAVLPGFTRTEFQDRADVSTEEIPDWVWQPASDVAREALQAVDAGRVRVVTGRLNKIAGGVARAVPTAVLRFASRSARRRERQ